MSETPERVAILGAGNQGHVFAGFLGLQEFDVTFVNRSESTVKKIREQGGIKVTGEYTGFVPLADEQVTTSVERGIKGCDVIILAVPAYGHEYYINRLSAASTLRDDQLILIPTDNYATLRLQQAFQAVETPTPPIAGAAISPMPGLAETAGTADIHGTKDSVPLAALPSTNTETACQIATALFKPETEFTPSENPFAVNFHNLNPYMHSAINVLNLARIDASADWLYYGEGCTPAVNRIVSGIDQERLATADALGLDVIPLRDLVATMYESQVSGTTIAEMLSTSPVHRTLPGPTTLDHEYITEDVPYGLVPLWSLSQQVGVECPTLESTIHLLSVGTDAAFDESGLTMADLGLEGLSADELLQEIS